MLKKTIEFEDLNGNEVSEDFYFHMTKAELLELEMGTEGGFEQHLQNIIKSRKGADIIGEFKKIILMAYGEKSEDGRRFIKNQELRDDFSQTEAFSVLFMDLATNAGEAALFINGIVPAGLAEDMAKLAEATDQSKTKNDGDELEEIEDPRPLWVQENREPTKLEMSKMSREELVLAFQAKSQG